MDPLEHDVSLFEDATVQALRTLFTPLDGAGKMRPKKPKSRLLWGARNRVERYPKSWFEKQNEIVNLDVLTVDHDVACRVFEIAGKLLSIGDLKYKMWERNTAPGEPTARDDPLYRQSLCRWFTDVVNIILDTGNDDAIAPPGYSQTQYDKHMDVIADRKVALENSVKKCLSGLPYISRLVDDLYIAWSDQMDLKES